MESNVEQPPTQPEVQKQEMEPMQERIETQPQPHEPPKEEGTEQTENPSAEVALPEQAQKPIVNEVPSDDSHTMKVDAKQTPEQESKQTSDDCEMSTSEQQEQAQQVTMEQGAQQIMTEQEQQPQPQVINSEPIIEQNVNQNEISNKAPMEHESPQINPEVQMEQQLLIERQITDVPQRNEMNETSQINPMQSEETSNEQQQQQNDTGMHATSQNEKAATPILVEKQQEIKPQNDIIEQPKIENNEQSHENIQNNAVNDVNESMEQPKVEQATINNDTDQIMTDNQQNNETQENEMKPEEPTNAQAQDQEIEQPQMAEPMDMDETSNNKQQMEMDETNNDKNAKKEEMGMKPELVSCINMLNEFMKRPETEPFNEPVDWKGLNLPDYPRIISKPMDLGTVSIKMSDGKYSTAEQFAVDVRLVFNNAMKFNQPGSGIYVVAENLSKQFERRYARITKSSANKKRKLNGTNSTFGQRQTFTQLLQQLTPQELGGVVELIDRKSPQALNDKFGAEDANEDEIEIEVYNIEGPILTELIGFIEKLIAKRGKKKGRKGGYY